MKKSLAAYIALAVLLGICLAASDAFRNPANLMNIARQVSYSGIIALGMTLVIAGGGIDLSSGSLVAFLKFLMALPMPAPISGSLLAPKIMSTMTRMMISSGNPIPNMSCLREWVGRGYTRGPMAGQGRAAAMEDT